MAKFILQEKLEKCMKLHGGKYDYSLVDYKHSKTKVNIICPMHGIFEQVITKHEKGAGCQECAEIKRRITRSAPSKSAFVNKAKSKHPQYDYSKSEYKKAHIKLTVTCNTHGDFDVVPYAFLRSIIGCPECSRLIMVQLNREKTFGWDKETWVRKGLKGNKFDSFKCYMFFRHV